MQPMIEPLRGKFGLSPLGLQDLQAEAPQWAGQALGAGRPPPPAGWRSAAWLIINLLGLLFLTPVVTFYLLRDWDEGCSPRSTARCPGTMP